MKVTIRITAQVHENYGGNLWKKKGGQEFTLEADSDTVMYMDNGVLVSKLIWVLKTQSNDRFKFTYIGHDVLFFDPIHIGRVEFEMIDEAAFAAFDFKG